MRKNLTGYSSRGKVFNTMVKATVLVLLFAVLCLAFSFSVSGVASADTSVSQTFANSSSASANEAVVSGSDDDENEAVTSGEATAASDSGGNAGWITCSDLTLSGSGTERTITTSTTSFNFPSGISNSTMSWYWTGSPNFMTGQNSLSASNGVITIDSAGHKDTQTMYIAFNVKLTNKEISYLLKNGASLKVTLGAKLKNTSGDDLFGFYAVALNDNTLNGAVKADDLSSAAWQGTNETMEDENSVYNIKNATFTLSKWTANNANGTDFSFRVAYRIPQEPFGGLRDINAEIYDTSLALSLVLPTDNSSPYNTVNTDSTSPYLTSLTDLPFNYGSEATDTEQAYTNFPSLLTDLNNSLDNIASSGSNTDTLNLKSYTNSPIDNVDGSPYYKKTELTITENSLIKSITISATDTESYVFYFYQNQSECTKTAWVKNSENKNVYYYSLYRKTETDATLTLYFAANTTVTVTTADYVGNSAGVTKITVGGIEKNDSDLSKLSVLSANGDDTAVELLNSGNWGGDTSWIYSLKAGDNGNSVLNFAVERTNDTEYVAHLVYFYRLYYSPSLAGLSSATEVMPDGVSSFHYSNGYILGYKNVTSFNVDLGLTNVANNSGYYRLEVSVANLAGTNKNGTAKNIYYFKVDADTEESTLSSDVKYTNNVGNVSFTDYLTNEYGLKYYWLGLKDLNSNGL